MILVSLRPVCFISNHIPSSITTQNTKCWEPSNSWQILSSANVASKIYLSKNFLIKAILRALKKQRRIWKKVVTWWWDQFKITQIDQLFIPFQRSRLGKKKKRTLRLWKSSRKRLTLPSQVSSSYNKKKETLALSIWVISKGVFSMRRRGVSLCAMRMIKQIVKRRRRGALKSFSLQMTIQTAVLKSTNRNK